MYISLSTCYSIPITRGKRGKKGLYEIPSEHTIEVYSNLSCIRANVNKRQITGGKNNSDKIEEKGRGNIPLMINLRFEVRALPSKSEGKQPYLPLTNCIITFRHLEERLSRSWLLPEFFFFCFFLLFNKRIF